ncbi:hypothetical protein PS712_03356 [Pseudomonas fluorescens]|uniref:Uncharacterized protein n=1 Tax=Pseudomonas fluorescens TaxID=294 RepID=A0A5E7DCV6_PSEFL|nr:hypothetical protein [Pseudomonas fluorescens]VVO09705.1 hypothetical protein PS712_03356 [Pseudomonas fluorescens]
MSAIEDIESLKTFGQIAAPAGLAISAFFYLGRDILAKNLFPILMKKHAYQLIVTLIVMGGVITLAGIASWTYVATHTPIKNETDSVEKILTPLPGDTGWIFAGYFNVAKGAFVEGPYVSIDDTGQRGLRRFVEIGDSIGLKVSRHVYIVDFKKKGTSLKLVSPITKGVVDEYDDTGITLPVGTKLVVRDLSEGKFPDNPNAALWLRVIHAPK